MLRQLPEVEEVVRVHAGLNPMLVREGRRGYELVNFVDGSYPDIFDIEFVHGDPATALSGHRQMVLSEAMAAKYFGDRDPRGEILSWDGNFDYEITGVAKVPAHTHFRFDILGSMASMDDDQFFGH